jgi:diaminopimelate epimerase
VSELRFYKGQALGNDYLVLEQSTLPWSLTPERIRAICDRHRGAGSDGILLHHPGDHPFKLRIYNPDGSEAEKSGNGLRIFGAYLHTRGLVRDERFQVELATDTVEMQVLGTAPSGGLDIIAAMGRANFDPSAVGFQAGDGGTDGTGLDLGDGAHARVHPVSLGNPHCVVIVDGLEREDFLLRAPRLAVHPAFRAGTNVQFARPVADDAVEAWIWERGAGETLASGSSACAVVAVTSRLGLVKQRQVQVRMPGGNVEIRLDEDGMLNLRGPASMVYRGEFGADFTAALARM